MAATLSTAPLVLIVGRVSPEASGVRGEAFALGQRYCTAVERAGGVPLMLPPISELGDRLDGLLRRVDAVVMHGGTDIDPRRYGATDVHEKVFGIEAAHDDIEFALVESVLAADLPLLAICRGMQVLNVALGGTLQQDIGTDDHWFAHREIDVEPDSLLARAVGTTQLRAHCVHHQGLDRVAEGLRPIAHDHLDGALHAVEIHALTWGLATQWHPEDTAAADPFQQALFTTLLAQA